MTRTHTSPPSGAWRRRATARGAFAAIVLAFAVVGCGKDDAEEQRRRMAASGDPHHGGATAMPPSASPHAGAPMGMNAPAGPDDGQPAADRPVLAAPRNCSVSCHISAMPRRRRNSTAHSV